MSTTNQLWSGIKSILWIIAEFIIFILIIIPIAGIMNFIIGKLVSIPDQISLAENPYLTLSNEYIPLLTAALVSLYVTQTLIFKRSWGTSGLSRGLSSLGTLNAGIIAVAFITIGFFMMRLLNYMDIIDIEFDARLFVGFILLFLVQSSFEEVVSRSFMIPSITARSNVWIALLISSSLFAVLHLTNPSISIISTLNIFLAGLVLGLLYLRFESVWPAISFHAAWNFFQGSFYGFEVSGYDVYSLIDSAETGPDWFTGGSFGFEGSVITTTLLICYSGYLIDKWNKNPKFLAERA